MAGRAAEPGRFLRCRLRRFQVARVLADAGERLTDHPGCFGGRVGGLDRLLLDPERVDLGLQAPTGSEKFFLLALQDGKLTAQVGDLLRDRAAAVTAPLMARRSPAGDLLVTVDQLALRLGHGVA